MRYGQFPYRSAVNGGGATRSASLSGVSGLAFGTICEALTMELRVAKQRLLDAIDILHPNLGLDALRLEEAVNDLVLAHLMEWKRMGCMRDGHLWCERCSPSSAKGGDA